MDSTLQTIGVLGIAVSYLGKTVYELAKARKPGNGQRAEFSRREVEQVMQFVNQLAPAATVAMEASLFRLEKIAERQTTILEQQVMFHVKQEATIDGLARLLTRMEERKQI